MSKIVLSKPTLFLLYGFPGAGKTYFARQLCETIQAAHLHSDRVRYELFESPRYDRQEDEVVIQLMSYMAEEFLNMDVSVVFDMNAMRISQRRLLREIARKSHAVHMLIWFQIDAENAYLRLSHRDRRRSDDRYARPLDRSMFDEQIAAMQNPENEDYVVLSGKHAFNSQRSAVLRKLQDLKLLDFSSAQSGMIKPGLVNLIPNPQAGRVDQARRNITIR
jgi:predicted kinase